MAEEDAVAATLPAGDVTCEKEEQADENWWVSADERSFSDSKEIDLVADREGASEKFEDYPRTSRRRRGGRRCQ